MNQVVLSTVLKSHKLDEMDVDTKRAEQYLEENRAGFTGNLSDINDVENFKCVLDSYGNKIYCDFKEITDYESKSIYNSNLAQYSKEFLKELAADILKEIDLFCQLEYLIRKVPINDTKQSIELFARELVSGGIPLYPKGKAILMEDSTPLLFLGTVSQILVHGCFTLVASKDTAVICHLFTQICTANNSCPHFIFQIGDDTTIKNNIATLTKFDYSMTQITGIITERSDIDSAVSTFLDFEYHPFPISHVMVQESIYEEFKSIMSWKCKTEAEKNKDIDEKIKAKCTDVFSYRKKLFLLNLAGKTEELNTGRKEVIVVEAYRTTNELLSLINKSIKPNCVSLWASGISEANEIALNADVPFIWINDCCKFVGPNKIARILFKELLLTPNTLAVCDAAIAGLALKQMNWSMTSFNQRYAQVLDIITQTDKGFGAIFATFAGAIYINNTVSVNKGTTLLNLYDPDTILGFTFDTYVDALKALIHGRAVVINKITDIVAVLFNKLAEAGLPVVIIDYNNTETKSAKRSLKLAHTKFIWTNYGTKFAN